MFVPGIFIISHDTPSRQEKEPPPGDETQAQIFHTQKRAG
jgi:hypothetical protein